jgi:hypothetical protein
LPGKHTPAPLGRLLAALSRHSEHLRRAWTTTIIVVAATAFVLSMIWVRTVSGSGPRPLMVQPAASTQPVYPVRSPPVPIRSPSAAPSPAARRAASTGPPRSRKPATPNTTAPAVTATYRTGASWDRGFIAMVQVHNTSKTAQNWSITIRFDDQSGVRIGPVWNAVTSRDGYATVLRSGAPLAPGGTVNVGFEATKRGRGQIRAPSCSINGSPCAMR